MLFKDTEILFEKPGDRTVRFINPGAHHFEAVDFEAEKEYEYIVYTVWGKTDVMPRDWSVVAWAEQESISIRHKDGLESGSFFNRDLNPDITIPQDFVDNGVGDHSSDAEPFEFDDDKPDEHSDDHEDDRYDNPTYDEHQDDRYDDRSLYQSTSLSVS